MKRHGILGLAGLLLIQSIIVAAAYTPRPHTGGDNAGYVALAHSLLDRGAYLELWDPAEPPHTKYPPGFPLLIAFAVLLGAKTWAALKLIPAFSVVLAVAFAFLWARERRGLAVGVGVALLLGISDSVVYYSQWVLSDPTFLAITTAALFCLERSRRSEAPDREEAGGGKGESGGGGRWLGAGLLLTLAAYFTRAAGLPLVVAALAWLGLRRNWKAFAAFLSTFGVLAFSWWMRGHVLHGSEYVSEFWLRDPYTPDLGTVGIGELLGRVTENFGAYATRFIPGGVVGDGFPGLPALGIGLTLLTLVGWFRALRENPGPAEFFLPLYFGLILLWPTVWSGDRFSLPILPLILLYSVGALLWVLGPLPPRVRQGVFLLLFLSVALPAGRRWTLIVEASEACRTLTREGNNWECLSSVHDEYFFLAEWSGQNLPGEAVVTTRKPRIFYVMSGLKTQAIPMSQETDQVLDRMRRSRSRYVSIDYLDDTAAFYILPVVFERPAVFCGMVEVGGGEEEMGTQLLGFMDERSEAEGQPEPTEALANCPPEMFRATPRDQGFVEGWGIPLLAQGVD